MNACIFSQSDRWRKQIRAQNDAFHYDYEFVVPALAGIMYQYVWYRGLLLRDVFLLRSCFCVSARARCLSAICSVPTHTPPLHVPVTPSIMGCIHTSGFLANGRRGRGRRAE